jgi:hypothetical protein
MQGGKIGKKCRQLLARDTRLAHRAAAWADANRSLAARGEELKRGVG